MAVLDRFFLINSIGLGAGLAMDAFSVCVANGLREPEMPVPRRIMMAGIYAFFQFTMPLIGWVCVHFIEEAFSAFRKFIPWIALLLLLYIGGGMIIEAFRSKKETQEDESGGVKSAALLPMKTLLIQGVATSIDALSVGFTISGYGAFAALLAALIIAAVTFVICLSGLKLGRVFGTKLERYAGLIGGTILIVIGLEIFIKSFI